MEIIVDEYLKPFQRISEIGLRLHVIRQALGISIADVMRRTNMGRRGITAVEASRGAVNNTLVVAKAIGVEIEITTSSEDSETTILQLDEIGSFIRSERDRRGLTSHALERSAGAGNGSLKAAENSKSSRIVGYDRYFDALNVSLTIQMKIKAKETLNPSISGEKFSAPSVSQKILSLPNTTISEKIGAALRRERKNLGYNLSSIAEMSRTGASIPTAVEKGRASILSVEAVARSMGFKVSLLITDSTGYTIDCPLDMVFEVLDTIRKSRNLTLRNITDSSTLSVATIMATARTTPSFETIEKYSKALDLSLNVKMQELYKRNTNSV
jgi:transcriptional regulator with XRE-family HTH domain